MGVECGLHLFFIFIFEFIYFDWMHKKKIFSNGVRMEHIHIDLRRAVLLTTENFMDY
jgi:hypothetical protein